MITDIPTPEEYAAAGLNQIYLAWQISMQSLHDHEEGMSYAGRGEDDETLSAEYW